MLQEVNGTIQEMAGITTVMIVSGGSGGSASVMSNDGGMGLSCGDYQWQPYPMTTWSQPYITWYGYPVYVCSDKTKKAIDVLKALRAEKILKCDSVPRFIALVEKISALL